MKIERKLIPESTIEEFADQHCLTMEVVERDSKFIAMPHIGAQGRFYAAFKDADIKDGYILIGAFGDGATEDEAIADYARQISECLLLTREGGQRREIKVPRLLPSKK